MKTNNILKLLFKFSNIAYFWALCDRCIMHYAWKRVKTFNVPTYVIPYTFVPQQDHVCPKLAKLRMKSDLATWPLAPANHESNSRRHCNHFTDNLSYLTYFRLVSPR